MLIIILSNLTIYLSFKKEIKNRPTKLENIDLKIIILLNRLFLFFGKLTASNSLAPRLTQRLFKCE